MIFEFVSEPYHRAVPPEPHTETVVLDRAAEKRKRGVKRVVDATHYSLDGLRAAWAGEDAFRQEIMLAVILTPVALVLPIALAEKILLVGVLMLVLIVELLNSAIEAAVDRDSLEINPLGKRAKDVGSAAVMLALLLAGGTWIAIVGWYFFRA
ncbi:MAG TPA: diacylglycerol kinase [Burkholderiaceae bacterium]|nr:diacylglycerol kinase [Burkholderiaceae bacterium]